MNPEAIRAFHSGAQRPNQILADLDALNTNLDAYRHQRCDPNHPARILKQPSTDLEGVIFL